MTWDIDKAWPDRVRELVAHADLATATAELLLRLDKGQSELHNEAVLLSSRLARLRGEVRRGVLSNDEAQRQQVILSQAVLEFLDEIARRIRSAPKRTVASGVDDSASTLGSGPREIKRPRLLLLHHALDDTVYAAELRKHLAPLIREGLAEISEPFLPGVTLDEEQARWLREGDVFLALLSAAYWADDSCEALLQRALERAGGGLRIVPVLVRSTMLEGTRLAGRQALPEDGRAVTEWRNRDAAWQAIAVGLRRLLCDTRAP